MERLLGRGHLSRTILILAYAAFGITMIVQPHRWNNTPSYANLIHIMSLDGWGAAYLFVSVTFAMYAAGYQREWFTIMAHTVAFALTAVWLSAFIIRYATDGGTTIANVVAWTVYLTLVAKASFSIDEKDRL